MSAPGKKAAMKFDLEKMFEETKRTAQAYSQEVKGELLEGLPLCLNHVLLLAKQVMAEMEAGKEEGEDASIGPPLPPQYQVLGSR